MKPKRLSKEDWNIIKGMIENKISITEISRTFDISRNSIYEMAFRKNWLKKKKKNFWDKLFDRLKRGGK